MPGRPEVWLRGPLEGFADELMPVAHSLEQSREEIAAAVDGLTPRETWVTPGGAASIGFHLKHIAGSIDRLLTYARGEQLTLAQGTFLRSEPEAGEPPAESAALLALAHGAIDRALAQIRETPVRTLSDARSVGRAKLPSTVVGLLFHAAEHTLRHAGQIVTTARIVRGLGLGGGRADAPPRDGRAVRWRLHLPVAPERVFELLATDEGRARFWAVEAPERDGVIAFRFPNGERCDARLHAVEPPSRFALSYFGGSSVEFKLERDGAGGTDLTLNETAIPPGEYLDNLPGWAAVLFALKGAALGIDLRTRDSSRSWSHGFVDG